MGRIGFQELLVIALIVMVLFGGARIPQLMRGLGQGIREFRKELRGEGEAEKPEEKPKDNK
jgi:sec-independent protein translocase protein TatA